MDKKVEAALPWALIGAASLGMFACTSGGTTRAPFLIDMGRDLSVGMGLVANLVSLTATAWGVASAVAGWLSDVMGRRLVLVASLLGLALTLVTQALAGTFFLLPDQLTLMSQILIFGLFAVSLDMALGYAGILTVVAAIATQTTWPSR